MNFSPEDGELLEGPLPPSIYNTYDPAFEWISEDPQNNPPPTSTEHRSSKPDSQRRKSLCRFIVSQTSVLPVKHRIVSMDGYQELQFGRDAPIAGADTPRVRLKEMEVSKLHATVYWDKQHTQWSIVDMGSKHGTFLLPQSNPDSSKALRLSPPRIASIPKSLRHQDKITIGSTTFVTHIHNDMLPCEECTTNGSDEIPLFPRKSQSKQATSNSTPSIPAMGYSASSSLDPKAALTNLKRNLLSTERFASSEPVGDTSSQYVDRSAKRRAFHPDTFKFSSSNMQFMMTQPEIGLPSVEKAPQNIGQKLLMQQGWQPGSVLGLSGSTMDHGRLALTRPLEVTSRPERLGLGMPSGEVAQAGLEGQDWKAAGKFKRYEEFKESVTM